MSHGECAELQRALGPVFLWAATVTTCQSQHGTRAETGRRKRQSEGLAWRLNQAGMTEELAMNHRKIEAAKLVDFLQRRDEKARAEAEELQESIARLRERLEREAAEQIEVEDHIKRQRGLNIGKGMRRKRQRRRNEG